MDELRTFETGEPEQRAIGLECKDKLWNANYCLAMIGNFMMFFSFYLLTPLLPIYLDAQFGADKDLIGLVLSGYVLAALVVRPFSGFIVDSFNRKKVLVLCFFIFFICFTGYIGASSILMFALVRTLHGFPFGATTVANSTVAIDVLPSARRNEGVGYYGLSNNLAMAIAPSVGIYIFCHRPISTFVLDFSCRGIWWFLCGMCDKAASETDCQCQAENEHGSFFPE